MLRPLLVLLTLSHPAFAEIPPWVGRSNAIIPKWSHRISGGVVTVAHWAPKPGETITFQDGGTGVIQSGWKPRKGAYHDPPQADVFIGWFDDDKACTTPPVDIWWTAPPGLQSGGWIEVEGTGLAEDGVTLVEFTALAHWREGDSEWDTGLWFYCPSGDEIRPGDSGAPVYHQGKLLGAIGGALWDISADHHILPQPLPQSCQEASSITIGVLNPLYWVFENWPRRFVHFERPAIDPCPEGFRLSWRSPYPWRVEGTDDFQNWTPFPGPVSSGSTGEKYFERPLSGKAAYRLFTSPNESAGRPQG